MPLRNSASLTRIKKAIQTNKNFWLPKATELLPGFGLIEVTIVLIIIGILASFGLKGFHLVEKSKLQSFISTLSQLKATVELIESEHLLIPGITEQDDFDPSTFWDTLNRRYHTSFNRHPTLGGEFSFVYQYEDFPGLWLKFHARGQPQKAQLTPQEAHMIDHQLDDGRADTGIIQSVNVSGQTSKCMTIKGTYDETHEKKACVLYYQLVE